MPVTPASVTPAIHAVSATPRATTQTAAGAPGDDFGAFLDTATAQAEAPAAEPLTNRTALVPPAEVEVEAQAPNDGVPDGASVLALEPPPLPPSAPPQEEIAIAAAPSPAEAPSPEPDPAVASSPAPPPAVPPVAAQVAAAGVAAAALAAIDAPPTQDEATATATAPEAEAVARTGSNAAAAVAAVSNALGADPATSRAMVASAPPSGAPDAPDTSTTTPAAAVAPATDRPATGAATATSAVLASTLDRPTLDSPKPAPDSAPPTAGQPAATATASAPATALTTASLSGMSHASAATMVHLAAQITKRLEGRSTQFEMVLTPEELGRVDVSLDIGADGKLAARLAFDNPLAATDLRGRADELRRQLEDAGFTLAQDALEFSQRDSSGSGAGFDRRQSRAFANASRNALDADAAIAPPAAWMSLTLTPRGVDMKV